MYHIYAELIDLNKAKLTITLKDKVFQMPEPIEYIIEGHGGYEINYYNLQLILMFMGMKSHTTKTRQVVQIYLDVLQAIEHAKWFD